MPQPRLAIQEMPRKWADANLQQVWEFLSERKKDGSFVPSFKLSKP